MARSRFTLDEAALQLLQLEPDDRTGAKALRDRLRRLARGRTLSDAVRAGVTAAADALTDGIRTGLADAIAAAGRHLEDAMLAAEDAAAPVDTEDVVAPVNAETGADSGSSTPFPESSPAIDPLMLAALAALESEEAVAPDGMPNPEAGAPVTWSSDADPELLEGFVAESTEYLQNAESALLELEADPSNIEAVNTVFRCFHTIKGTSGFLGLDRISDLAHRAESLMSRVRDREIRLEGGYAELALRSVDMLVDLVRAVAARLAGRDATEPAGYAELFGALGDPDAAIGRLALDGPRGPKEADAEPAERTATTADHGHEHDVLETWMRVRTDRLDRLVDTIGELVIAHSMIAQDRTIVASANEELSKKVAHASKIVRELQDLSISMRMVPLKGVFQKLARVVRDAAAKSGKRVDLITEGEETEIDRSTVEVIGDPLIHMIRNAVDHGIEEPDERERIGKPRRGTIRLSARHAGGSVVITLSDDGRGLNRARILEKAVQRGLVDPDRGLSDHDVVELIFAPGFSTAEQVTDLSGRGVGMDVVRRSVEHLRGRIDIDSAAGRGSTFSIRLPLTLAITDGMLVRIGGERYILPTLHIQMSFRPERSMLSTVGGRGELVMLRDEVLPIVRLQRILNVPDAQEDPTLGLLVVVGSGERRCALLVDELLGQQQLVAKSLGDGIQRVPGISGGAILGDGRVGLIIDVAEIMSLARQAGPATRAA